MVERQNSEDSKKHIYGVGYQKKLKNCIFNALKNSNYFLTEELVFGTLKTK